MVVIVVIIYSIHALVFVTIDQEMATTTCNVGVHYFAFFHCSILVFTEIAVFDQGCKFWIDTSIFYFQLYVFRDASIRFASEKMSQLASLIFDAIADSTFEKRLVRF